MRNNMTVYFETFLTSSIFIKKKNKVKKKKKRIGKAQTLIYIWGPNVNFRVTDRWYCFTKVLSTGAPNGNFRKISVRKTI